MSINKLTKIFFALSAVIFSCKFARAESGVEISRDLSATAKANNLSLNYKLETDEDEITGIFGFSHKWGYDFSSAVANINLNSNLDDFEIRSLTHRLTYDFIVNEAFTLAVKVSTEVFNTDEARQNIGSVGVNYQFDRFQLGYMASTTDTYQEGPVVILGTDYKEQIRFNRKSASYFVGFNWSKTLGTTLNYTEYTYDKNLDSSYTALTTAAFLNRAGGAVANEIGSQLKSSLDLNVSYSLTEKLLLLIGLGSSQEYLSPSAKSNNVSVGLDYETNTEKITYRFFGLLDVAKTVDVDGTSISGQLGTSINF